MPRISIDKEDFLNKMQSALEGTGIDVVEELQLKAPFATGHLRDNITFNVKRDGAVISLDISLPVYAKWLEWGRNPGKMPPVEDIREWCIAVGIEPEAAWPIAKAIAKFGTRSQPFIRPVINQKLAGMLRTNLAREFK